MCRFDDAANMVRFDIKFGQHGNLVVTFRKRKNDQYCHGTSIAIVSNVRETTCPVLLLRRLLDRVPCEIGKDNSTPIFHGFNGSHVRNLSGDTTPHVYSITFGKYSRFLSQWFGTLMEISAKYFVSVYGSHSGRIGGAPAAANANVPMERWGQHMGSNSRSSQISYMHLCNFNMLYVSLAIMSDPENFPDERVHN
jgi:hypothetical protein